MQARAHIRGPLDNLRIGMDGSGAQTDSVAKDNVSIARGPDAQSVPGESARERESEQTREREEKRREE